MGELISDMPKDQKAARVVVPAHRGDPYFVLLVLPTRADKTDGRATKTRRRTPDRPPVKSVTLVDGAHQARMVSSGDNGRGPWPGPLPVHKPAGRDGRAAYCPPRRAQMPEDGMERS